MNPKPFFDWLDLGNWGLVKVNTVAAGGLLAVEDVSAELPQQDGGP